MTAAISLHSLLESHDQPFAIIDATLTIQGVNKAYESYFKQPRERLIGQPCCRVTGDDPPPEGCRHSRLFQELEPYRLTHTHEAGEGGVSQSFQVRGFPLVGSDRVIYLGESILPLALRRNADTSNMVGQSGLFKEMVKRLELAAGSLIPVLLQGETGTGKEVAAQFLHAHSLRADGPLVVVDCTVLGEELFESELFGHEKGAFTGASAQKKGLFELANGGTLFLDEVGELPLSQQPKLLRALESGAFRRVGGSESRQSDVRVVSATHRNLREMVRQGRFREDLYYRLAVFSVSVPPLRQRIDDAGLIGQTLLDRIGESLGRTYSLSTGALSRLQSHDFPGNVRELRNILQLAATVTSSPLIDASSIVLPERCSEPLASRPPAGGDAAVDDGNHPLERMEIAYLRELLNKHDGSRRKVAQEMDISERTLYRKLKRYRLND
jgi:transcriptional regulator with PAS, ATPase and Fis domain